MNNEKYLEKIKKLLNLARRSTNPNEAANAIRQAQNLMREHGISEDQATFAEINKACSKKAPSNAEDWPKHVWSLLNLVSKVFGVQGYGDYSYSERARKYNRAATFYGPDSRPIIAAYAFDVLSRQMLKARAEYFSSQRKTLKYSTRLTRADEFCEGWVKGASQVLEKLNVSKDEAELMDAFYKHLMKSGSCEDAEIRKAKPYRGNQYEAINQGFVAGKSAQLSHGLNGQSQHETVLAIGGE